MPKRGNGEGSIFQRADGRWAAQVDLGYRDGKRRRKTVYGGSRRAVAEKLKREQRAAESSLTVSPERLTLATFLTDWLKQVRPKVRHSTFSSYELQVRKHIAPELGSIKLMRLRPDHLQSLYSAKASEGLSPRSVRYIHVVLRSALGDAERWGLVMRNVARLVDPPRLASTSVETLARDDVRAFIQSTEGDRLHALYVLACAAGLRRGELLALRWSDLDLSRCALSVQRALTKAVHGWEFADPKTVQAKRVIKLPTFAVQALRDHRIEQLEERLAAAGLEPHRFTFHSLRHSAASVMLAEGVQPKVVQEVLGHSSIKVTMDTYSHVFPHLQDEAAAKIQRALGAV